MSRLPILVSVYRALRGTVILTPWVLHLFVADLALSALLPVSILLPSVAYNTSSRIAQSVWYGIQSIFTRNNGARITMSGAELPKEESAIVIANHVEWTDFYMIQALAIKARMLGRCRWFAKQQLKWVPFLGWGLWAMGMPLVSRNWIQDRAEMQRVFGDIINRQWPIWLISYSEATRFTQKKYQETVEWCKANDKPIPRHTLYPRTKGFVATVNQLRQASHVEAVYDVTIAYAKGNKFLATPTFWETVSNPRVSEDWRFHVHVERHSLDSIPESDSDLAQWLEDRWMEKGERLEELREQLSRGLPWGSSASQETL